jgi:hypothetical protein
MRNSNIISGIDMMQRTQRLEEAGITKLAIEASRSLQQSQGRENSAEVKRSLPSQVNPSITVGYNINITRYL